MKLLKKIVPLAVVALLGLTSFAVAADLGSWRSSFPGADTALVFHQDADAMAVVDLTAALGSTGAGGGASTTGDTAQIKGTGTELNINDVFKQTLDDGDLDMLSDGTFYESTGENDNDVDYSQQLTIDPDSKIKANYQADTEESNNPADMLVKIPDSENAYTYKLNFKKAVKVDVDAADTDMKTTHLDILGREYTISKVDVDSGTHLISEIKLLSGAVQLDAIDETPITATVDSTEYTVTPDIYSDNSVKLTIEYNGKSETTDKMKGGDTYKLQDGTQIGIKDVWYSSKESKTSSVSIYLGSHEITLDDGDEVEVDGEDIDGSEVTLSQTTTGAAGTISLTAIQVDVPTESDIFLASGESWADPAFGAFKVDFAGLKEDTNLNVVDISTSSSSGSIDFVNSAGDDISLPLIEDGAHAYIGKGTPATYLEGFLDKDETMATMAASSGTTDTTDHYFIVTTNDDGSNAHLFKIDKIVEDGTAGDDKVYIKDLTADVDETVAIKIGAADTADTTLFGDWNFQLTTTAGPTLAVGEGAGDGEIIATAGDATTSGAMIKLKDGATIGLATGADPTLYLSEDGTLNQINAQIVYTAADTELQVLKAGITPTPIAHDDDSKDYTAYTDWGAKLDWNSDNYDLTITSPEDQTEVLAYAAETGATIVVSAPGVGGAATGVYDTDVATASDMNLISVGGSGINSFSAELLGLDYPTYGSDPAWANATGVDTMGKAIVKIMDSPYTTGKYAMLVAGWEDVDTARAAKALREGTPALSGTSALLDTSTETVTQITA